MSKAFQSRNTKGTLVAPSTLRFRITGSGTAFPRTEMDNAALAAELGLEASWIEQRCGVEKRFVAAEDETTTSLAIAAAREALKHCQAPDLLICSTFTPDHLMCPVAPCFSTALGLQGIGAFDVNGGCVGGLLGLVTSAGYLWSGLARRVLLVASDTTTRYLSSHDVSTRILFSDGAAALVLERAEEEGFKILSWLMGSDGRGVHLFSAVPERSSMDQPPFLTNRPVVHMDGPGLFRFAVERGCQLLAQLCERGDVLQSEISYVIVHQANIRIIQALQQRLQIPRDKWIVNVDRYGNTASASLLLALIDCLAEAKMKRGDLVLLGAFGAGLTWAGTLLEWQTAP